MYGLPNPYVPILPMFAAIKKINTAKFLILDSDDRVLERSRSRKREIGF